ncbi:MULTISPECIES: 3'-5' exonuclease [unclassified Moraxella]|uniref:3'-5' exonuclease n=1 Tax=unclassified Moraxella TaxID=2685852 RepID=UPI003AF48AB0
MTQKQPPILVFDIETIPDVATGKRLYPELAELSDDEALSQLIDLRKAETDGNPFMPLPLHKIACLSVLWVANGKMTLKSLSLADHSESEILQTFFNSIDKTPSLVSWNGKGFDIPVMLYRALQHGLSVPKLFQDTGDMKYNNYLNRYHDRHTDLMVKLAMGGTFQKLDIVASVCGFAGKQDIDGYDVVPMVQAGEWDKLTTYCESDVLNTWLIYLRYLRLAGKMTAPLSEQWQQATHDYLQSLKGDNDDSLRHQKFLDAWQFIQPNVAETTIDNQNS